MFLNDDESLVDKSLVVVAAYHCHRCGYIWLPKDYDVSDNNTLEREPKEGLTYSIRLLGLHY